MSYKESSKRAEEVASLAFQQMKNLEIAPYPDNYEVWYAYHGDLDADLSRQLKAMLDNADEFDPKAYRDIKQAFLGEETTKILRNASDGVEAMIASALTSIDAASTNARDYGDKLADFSGDDDKENLVIATFGRGFESPYLLTLLEASLTIDWRGRDVGENPALSPKRGSFFQLGVRQSLPIASPYLFTDITGDMRLYKNFRFNRNDRKLNDVIAMRIKGKIVQPWILKDENGDAIDYKLQIPYAERAFLGGTNDMRGFRVNAVGAYDCVCQPATDHTQGGSIWSPDRRNDTYRSRQNPTYLPRGGRISAMMSFEYRRLRLGIDQLTGALFTDMGLLLDDWSDFADFGRRFRFNAGFGLRYETPIGPIRLDFTFRPTYPEDRPALVLADSDPDDPWQGRYYGCDAAEGYAPVIDRLPKRGFGVNSYSYKREEQGKEGLPPVAFGITIAIGEAF